MVCQIGIGQDIRIWKKFQNLINVGPTFIPDYRVRTAPVSTARSIEIVPRGGPPFLG